jgi:hypothetical protein
MMITEQLPTYEDSISVQPPPQYCMVAITSHQCPYRGYYYTEPLRLVDISTTDEIDSSAMSFASYTTKTNEEIYDSFKALSLVMDDKIKQIDRNIEFMNKKMRTRSRNYYIDRLRSDACEDFQKIKQRIMGEMMGLQKLFTLIVYHNVLFEESDTKIIQILSELEQTTTKEQMVHLEQQYNTKLMSKAQVVKNLELLQERVSMLASTDDVSYVLKERARIYNDAKEIVRRQSIN